MDSFVDIFLKAAQDTVEKDCYSIAEFQSSVLLSRPSYFVKHITGTRQRSIQFVTEHCIISISCDLWAQVLNPYSSWGYQLLPGSSFAPSISVKFDFK